MDKFLNPAKFITRLSLALLLFFSLQGEVAQRYIHLYKWRLEHHITPLPKKVAEHQQLSKLQCFTQKFLQVAFPLAFFEFKPAFTLSVKPYYVLPKNRHYKLTDCSAIDSRGPPVLS